jgi:hypothetical protein
MDSVVRAVLLGALLLGHWTCGYTYGDEDRDENVRSVVVSRASLTASGLEPGHLIDLDGDGAPDVAASGRWFLARGDGWIEIPEGFSPTEFAALEPRTVLLEDSDGDGGIDRILVDGQPFPAR